MGKKDSANYKAALAAHKRLGRIRVAKPTPAYDNANGEAHKTYNKLTRTEKVRFAFDSRND